jgi:hypothetical protein
MADKLTDYLQEHPCKGFRPVPFDFVTYYARGERCFERRIDDLLTVYLSMETEELVGCKIKGVKHLFTAHECGVPMPGSIIVKDRFLEEENDDPNEMAYYVPGTGSAPGELYINAGHPAWDDIAAATQLVLDAEKKRSPKNGSPARRAGKKRPSGAQRRRTKAISTTPRNC